MSKRRTKSVPFNTRSRTVQKRAYWKMLCKIRRAAPVLGGAFYTHQYMHGENGWLDAYFLGTTKPAYYNLSLQTIRYRYKELVEEKAWTMSYELAPQDRDPSIFERTAKDPISGLYVTPPHVPILYPELDGMTRYAWAQAQTERIAVSGEIQVFEGWNLHRNYGSGIGLHATIDVPFLTTETVNEFIHRFLETESAFQSQEARSLRFDQVPRWGIEPNSVCDPWDWTSNAEAGIAETLADATTDQVLC